MKPQRFGAYSVRKLVEVVEPFMPDSAFLDWNPEAIEANAAWLEPHFVGRNGDGATLTFSFHSFVVEGEGRTVLIDTCIGNDKDRPALPFWHRQNRPFLANLRSLGIAPEDVDYVMCTHLHADHVGWNTMLQDGRWAPTFPNARYVFSRADYDRYNAIAPGDPGYDSMTDSVRPIVEAGQAALVDMDFALGDALTLLPAPGHTPGHYCVRLHSEGTGAVFTGDLMHHPVQVAHPEWRTRFCADPVQAVATRQAFLDRYIDSGTAVLAAHFAGPTAGCIVDAPEGARFETLAGA